MTRIMFVAGDPSGDRHASRILARLKTLLPEIECFGIGGPAMQEQGFLPLLPFEPFNRMGFKEVAFHLGFFLKAKHLLISEMERRGPDALICVDYPGFNMGLMKQAHHRGIPVVWYIVPQVWAWKRKRAAVLGAHAAFIGAVFPFEVKLFEGFAARTEFVGHPLVEALDEQGSVAPRRLPAGALHLAIIPGSRSQEIGALLGPMVDAFRVIRKERPDAVAVISRVPHLDKGLFSRFEQEPGISISTAPLADVVDRCDIALVTSGTATLETALRAVPMVIAYRTSEITYRLLRALVKIPHIGLPNIVSGRGVVPECIQHQVRGPVLAGEVLRIISSRTRYEGMSRDLAELRAKLAGAKPSHVMARKIFEIVTAADAA